MARFFDCVFCSSNTSDLFLGALPRDRSQELFVALVQLAKDMDQLFEQRLRFPAKQGLWLVHISGVCLVVIEAAPSAEIARPTTPTFWQMVHNGRPILVQPLDVVVRDIPQTQLLQRKDRLQKKRGNKPRFDLRQQLFRMTGTDLTMIDGIDVMTAATILREAGWDMTKWKNKDHFVSWLRLSPDNRISGDRIIGKGRLPTTNRVTVALKLAANCLRTSQSYLGAQFRRFKARLDTPVAIKAMAAKLARLVYRMLRYGTKYVDRGAQFYEVQQRTRDIRRLKQRAANLGFQLLQASAPAG